MRTLLRSQLMSMRLAFCCGSYTLAAEPGPECSAHRFATSSLVGYFGVEEGQAAFLVMEPARLVV